MRSTVTLILATAALAGCNSAPAPGPSPAAVAKANDVKKEMSAKLRTMTGEERVQYMKQHAGGMNTILEGTGMGMGSHKR